MKAEKELTLRGSTKEEAFEALRRAKEFVTKKPEKDYYRFSYISINDTDNVNHKIFICGRLSDKAEEFVEHFATAEKMISGVENLERFHISVKVEKENVKLSNRA